jgi:3-methyladenine DNA glycosylase AlkD
MLTQETALMYEEFQDFLKKQGGIRDSAQAQQSYTGAIHTHLDVAVPTLRAFVKGWAKEKQPTYQEWVALLTALYTGVSVEERLIAGMLLSAFPKYRAQLPLDQLSTWLEELVGWAEVDGTCQSIFTSKEMLTRWEEWEKFLRGLVSDPNINKCRASLVLLNLPIRESTDKRFLSLALTQIDVLKGEKDKLISKAVSWLLREAIKHHKEDVARYLETNVDSLPKSVVREVQTKLMTGKKQ